MSDLESRTIPKVGPEKDVLRAFLANYRAVMAWKLDGVSGDTVAGVVDLYRRHIARADAVIEAADLDDLSVRDSDGARFNLRWILLHLIEETARHAGHADIIREQIDGATGYFPRR